ncbi:hypothetical protein PG985_003287 [Apiospora marii]|uniref:uncharacterized protein n=1 Tax=Apiospora marii TaxID=335849 RepID=UPI00312DD2DF
MHHRDVDTATFQSTSRLFSALEQPSLFSHTKRTRCRSRVSQARGTRLFLLAAAGAAATLSFHERQQQASRRAPNPLRNLPRDLPAGAPPRGPFHVDVPTLRREFLKLQAKAHPDMHPQAHKHRADAASARINEAFKTLTNPLLRAQYLLELAGRGDNPGTDEAAKVEDPELLMEVLEAREMIEEAESEEDLAPLRDENMARERGSEGVLDECFKTGDLERAAAEAVRLRYWVNIRESIDAWERGKPVVLEH